MGSKKTLPLYYAFNARAISSTSTYTSTPTWIANLDNVGCQVIFSGTPTGTLSVLVSNDNVNFDSITFDPVLTQPTGTALHYAINLNELPWPWVGFSYTNASGSGSLTVTIFGKDLN